MTAVKPPRVHVVSDMAAAGPAIAGLIERRIQRDGRCRLALSGGSTPAPALRWLAEHLDARIYAGLWVTLVDERHLPLIPGAEGWRAWPEGSNWRLAWSAWLSRAAAPWGGWGGGGGSRGRGRGRRGRCR